MAAAGKRDPQRAVEFPGFFKRQQTAGPSVKPVHTGGRDGGARKDGNRLGRSIKGQVNSAAAIEKR
jgi:hypothetical protein